MNKGLDSLTYEEKQQLLHLLIDRISVDNGMVKVEAVMPVGDRTQAN